MSMPLITWFMNRATAEQSLIAADTAHRRASRNYQDALDDTVDQFTAEIRAHNALKERHAQLERRYDQALYLVRVLANRAESFRRTASHLRRNWTPNDPGELPLKETLRPLVDQQRAQVDADPEWRAKRERQLANDLARADE